MKTCKRTMHWVSIKNSSAQQINGRMDVLCSFWLIYVRIEICFKLSFTKIRVEVSIECYW